MFDNNVLEAIRNVRKAATRLSLLSDSERCSILERGAAALLERSSEIIEANRIDLEESRKKGISEAILHRIALGQEKLESTVDAMRAVMALPCPI
ncbi:MAG: hypothetical protein IJ831_07790, partial [Spirochaetales bacterium]|nr:hypothetical protein [Spirochaetales bacterium]